MKEKNEHGCGNSELTSTYLLCLEEDASLKAKQRATALTET